MLNTIFYISDNYIDFSNNISEESDSGIILSYLITTSNQKKIEETYQFFSEKNIRKFSLTLIIDTPLDNYFLYYLVSFFFLPGYLKINSHVSINFIYKKDKLLNTGQNDLMEISARQGIKNLQINVLAFEYLSTPTKAQLNTSLLFSNIDNFKLVYTNTLQSSTFYDNTFYINHKAIELEKLHSIITNANDFIKINNRSLYDVALKSQILSLENSKLKLKQISLINELENYKTHITVLKSVHEATELQLYYDKEYEVLPIWYKRFGHILKFIMGKRNFKSLFNNK